MHEKSGRAAAAVRADGPVRSPGIPALTGVRFIAAFMVLLGHSYPVVRFADTNRIGTVLGALAPVGMSLFFTLSGFLLWFNYSKDFENGIGSKPLANFAAARFARLYPLYICVLVLGSITTSWDSLAAAFPRALLFLPLVQAWFPTNGSSVLILSVWDLAHSWSISVEFFLYILFPALGLLTWRMNSRTGLLTLSVLNMSMLAVLVMICTTRTESIAHRIGPELSQDQAMMWLLYYSPVTHVFEFVQGCYACALVTRFGKAALPFRSVFAAGLFLLVSGTFITGWSGIVPQQPSLAAFRYVAVSTAFFLLLYVVAAEENFCLTRLLSTRVLVAGGEISYSVYLLHPFILKWFVKPVQPVITFVGVMEWLYVIVSALACIFVLSYGSYALIEVPARRWLRNRLTGSRIHHEPTWKTVAF